VVMLPPSAGHESAIPVGGAGWAEVKGSWLARGLGR
jgi:hypothetical protein